MRLALRGLPSQFAVGNVPENAPFPMASPLLLTSDLFDLLLQPLTEDGVYFYPVPEGSSMEVPEIVQQVDVLRENIHTIFLRPTRKE